MHQPSPSNIATPARLKDPATIPLRPLNRTRHDFLTAFDDFLKTSADPAAALLELESTINALRGLVALAFPDLADHSLVTGISPAAHPE